MASIYKRNKKLWISYFICGKQYREPLNLKATKQGFIEAKKILKRKEAELSLGYYTEKLESRIDLNLSDAFNLFLQSKKNKAEATIIAYNCAYNKLLDFCGNIKLKKIDTNLIEKFEYHLRTIPFKKNRILTKTSISTYFRTLRIMFKYFVEKNYININPFPKIKAPEKEIITIPLEELKNILEKLFEVNYEHYKIIMMFLLTGLRAGELLRLNFEDIDLENNLLTIKNTKGKRNDLFPIYPKLKNFILENFEFGKGKIFNYKNKDSLKFWGRFLKKYKFNHYSIHTLRKTFITILVNGGMNIFDVSKLARHKDIKTTLRSYASVDIERLGNEADRIENLSTIISTKYKNNLKIVK